jgi:hypothetical protein
MLNTTMFFFPAWLLCSLKAKPKTCFARQSTNIRNIRHSCYSLRVLTFCLSKHRTPDRMKRWDKSSKYFVSRHKYFVIASDEIDFSINQKLIVGWSERLNKINILKCYRNLTMILSGILSNNFWKLPDLLKFCSNYLINVFSERKEAQEIEFLVELKPPSILLKNRNQRFLVGKSQETYHSKV